MKLTEETYIQVFEDLKNENVQLRKEVAELNAENIRLQEVANDALFKGHPLQSRGDFDLNELPDDKDTLKTENEMLKSIIDNLGMGVAITDINGNILSLNKEALRIHGIQSEEEIFSLFQRYSEEYQLQYSDGTTLPSEEWPLALALRLEFVRDYEVKLIKLKDNTSRFINYSIIPVYNDACERMLIVFNMIDISDFKKINQEQLGVEKSRRSLFDDFNENEQILNKSIASIKDISERKQVEQTFRESEQRFRLLADNITQIAWITDGNGDVLWYNKRWFDYTGIPLEVIKEKGYRIVLHPNFADQVLNSFSNSILKTEPWEEIYPLQSKEGTFRWFLARALPIYDHNGNVEYWFGTNTDITDQRAVEDALRESEKRLEAIFNNAAIGIVEVNKDNQFVLVNDRTCEILGYSRDEMLTKTVMEITAPEDREVSDSYFHKLHTGELNILNYEKRYLKSDGTPLWVHVSVSVIRDDKGQHIKSIGTIEDISERKKIENALQESEEMFSTMFQSAPVSISLSKLDGTLFNVNQAWLQLTGFNKEEAIGKKDVELEMIVDNKQRKQIVDEFTSKGYVRNIETTFHNKRGVERVVYLSIDKIFTRGQQFRLSTIEDITEQKKIEKEIIQKNEELTRFIYTVSHDLKSPLVTIKSFASFLVSDIESDAKEAVEKDLGYIRNAADKMGRLLDELLELSRIGRKEELKEEVPLREIAKAAINLVSGRITNGNVHIQFVGPPVILYGYRQRLIQLYQNLIDNAVKFMGKQPNPLVEIGTLIESDKLIFFVRDNGIGIDPRYHHKIFGLFEKLDNSSEGTGIGLALIKRIVEVHGGTIWFQSEGAGMGTTFFFTLEKAYKI